MFNLAELVPHRAPFLFIDELLDVKPGVACSAKVFFSEQSSVFKGHFPGYPILPGVIITEAMLQTGVPVISAMDKFKDTYPLLASIEFATFKKPVYPNEHLLIDVRLEKLKLGKGKMHGIVTVNESVVAEASWLFAIVKM